MFSIVKYASWSKKMFDKNIARENDQNFERSGRWLGHMASHKYFNYTGLMNTPCARWRLLVRRRHWFDYLHRCIAAFCIVMLLSHFSNNKPARCLVHLNGFSYSELFTNLKLSTSKNFSVKIFPENKSP